MMQLLLRQRPILIRFRVKNVNVCIVDENVPYRTVQYTGQMDRTLGKNGALIRRNWRWRRNIAYCRLSR